MCFLNLGLLVSSARSRCRETKPVNPDGIGSSCHPGPRPTLRLSTALLLISVFAAQTPTPHPTCVNEAPSLPVKLASNCPEKQMSAQREPHDDLHMLLTFTTLPVSLIARQSSPPRGPLQSIAAFSTLPPPQLSHTPAAKLIGAPPTGRLSGSPPARRRVVNSGDVASMVKSQPCALWTGDVPRCRRCCGLKPCA